MIVFFFFKQKTAYEMRISDWSSDVCSSDLPAPPLADRREGRRDEIPVLLLQHPMPVGGLVERPAGIRRRRRLALLALALAVPVPEVDHLVDGAGDRGEIARSEEHTSELQSLMRISYDVFCLKKKKKLDHKTAKRKQKT